MDQDATWYGGRPQPTRHYVRWGPSSPSPKVAQPPIFGQCPLWPNGWMAKMPLGMEVGLGPGDSVFDGCPPEKRAHSPHPIFGPCILWINGCMDKDATWYGSRPRPRPHCIRRGPSWPRKGHSSPSFFSAQWRMSIVATDAISATAELLFYRPTEGRRLSRPIGGWLHTKIKFRSRQSKMSFRTRSPIPVLTGLGVG